MHFAALLSNSQIVTVIYCKSYNTRLFLFEQIMTSLPADQLKKISCDDRVDYPCDFIALFQ